MEVMEGEQLPVVAAVELLITYRTTQMVEATLDPPDLEEAVQVGQ
jgi:hypothetical protein